jgi:hypothetical protein
LFGTSVKWSRENALPALTEQTSYQILRNGGVSAVYGIAKPATDDWPYTFDSNAAKLIEEISKRLMWPGKSIEMDSDGKLNKQRYLSREEITNLQRAAIEGATAIATAIDVDAGNKDDEVDLFIRKCYTWGTALKSLNGYPRAYSTTFVSRAAEKPRGGIAIAQPMSDSVYSNRQ